MDGLSQDLVDRLRRAEERDAVVRVLHEYAEALDYGFREQFLGCFSDDAVFEIRFPEPVDPTYPARGGRLTSHGVEYVGRTEIAAFFDQHTHAPEAAHKHAVANSIVDIDGDVAHVRSYFQRLDVREDGGIFTRTFGRYVDECRRVDGRWRIARRVGEPDAIDLQHIRINGGTVDR